MKKKLPHLTIIILFLMLTIPYLFGFISGGGQKNFLGFLLNPIDGLSYLAKIEEGRAGQWLFTLPYAANPGKGSIIFIFYLLLGHLGRLTQLSNIFIFHLARLMASVFLVGSVWQLLTLVYKSEEQNIHKAFTLLTLGSGLGWLVFLTGFLPADFWLAEMYPFLSMYANPHFPLGLALLIQILLLYSSEPTVKNFFLIGMTALGVGFVMPFGLVFAVLILCVDFIVEFCLKKKVKSFTQLVALIPGGMVVILQYWQTISHNLLSEWNNQNVTPSPQVWDLMLSLSPAILITVWEIAQSLRSPGDRPRRLLRIWLIAGMVLAYLPLALQRRFLMGVYLPAAILAVDGLNQLSAQWEWIKKWGYKLLLIVSIPTNLIMVVVGMFGVVTGSPKLFVSTAEKQALDWISANSPAEAVFASSDEFGLVIPAMTGRKVIFGHPFETPNYAGVESALKSLYSLSQSEISLREFSEAYQVDYFVCGFREKEIWKGTPCFENAGKTVFRNSELEIITPIHENQ